MYSSCACLYTYCTMQSVCIYSWPAPELGIGTYVLRDPAITKARNMWADDQEIFFKSFIPRCVSIPAIRNNVYKNRCINKTIVNVCDRWGAPSWIVLADSNFEINLAAAAFLIFIKNHSEQKPHLDCRQASPTGIQLNQGGKQAPYPQIARTEEAAAATDILPTRPSFKRNHKV